MPDIVEQLPRGRGHLADQLVRASLSIVNNAEDVHRRGKLLLDHIVAMLVALSKNLQD